MPDEKTSRQQKEPSPPPTQNNTITQDRRREAQAVCLDLEKILELMEKTGQNQRTAQKLLKEANGRAIRNKRMKGYGKG
ncbi:8831_t:CDS:2 [Gigaspora margarita]|uniref:8831_t:CDS:1 n=1 Tax=Gigaspora margarita TaxID=4874 RepID=A0ABN7ULR7_GIGMA|nr:8831_t:CDS:2 [Gigaspora margarita]